MNGLFAHGIGDGRVARVWRVVLKSCGIAQPIDLRNHFGNNVGVGDQNVSRGLTIWVTSWDESYW